MSGFMKMEFEPYHPYFTLRLPPSHLKEEKIEKERE